VSAMSIPAQSNSVLWFAVGGGPIAWSIDSLSAIAIEQDYCASGGHGPLSSGAVTALLLAIGALAVLVTLLAFYSGWRYSSAAGADTGEGDTDLDRQRFMARFGMGVAGLTLFGIVLRAITVLIVSPITC
jgi:hypothetical protein